MNTNRDTTDQCAAQCATPCEIVGWLLIDEATHVLVREENGRVASQAVSPASTFAHQAIQTGSFRRNPIIDPLTHETLGYEMEPLPGLLDAVA